MTADLLVILYFTEVRSVNKNRKRLLRVYSLETSPLKGLGSGGLPLKIV